MQDENEDERLLHVIERLVFYIRGDSRPSAQVVSPVPQIVLDAEEILDRRGRAREVPSPAARAIRTVCADITAMLLAKNAAYGNSALDPVRVFSKASPTEQILVRLDDKLSRLARGHAAGEDVVRDLIGYLVLLLISQNVDKGVRL